MIGKCEYDRFQFHKGTIKTTNPAKNNIGIKKFQFHKGTIKTSAPKLQKRIPHDFNSIKVRLKLHSQCYRTVFRRISIP